MTFEGRTTLTYDIEDDAKYVTVLKHAIQHDQLDMLNGVFGKLSLSGSRSGIKTSAAI